MDFLEKDLEQIIWESSDEQLNEAGLNISGKRFRQLRIGNYGVADLVTIERFNDWNLEKDIISLNHSRILIKVYELKKDKIGISAFLQAVSYVKGIKRYIEKRGIFNSANVEYKICLIGRDADTSGGFIYLPELMTNNIDDDIRYNGIQRPLSIYFFTYRYSISGLKFTEEYGHSLLNEGF